MLGGRFKAAKIEAESSPLIQKTVGLSSLFQARLAETPKKPLPPSAELSPSQLEEVSESAPETKLEEKEDI